MKLLTAVTKTAAAAGRLSLGLGLVLAGCRYDGTGTKMQWAPDMADAPTVKSQENYLDPPVGAVAMSALLYPATVEEAEKVLAMPEAIANSPKTLESGKVMFETFCAVCHGPGAKGDGTLGPNFPRPPDITGELYAGRSDGFFFYRITFGSAIMPSYGHAITAPERWMIVKYLRTLQKAGQ